MNIPFSEFNGTFVTPKATLDFEPSIRGYVHDLADDDLTYLMGKLTHFGSDGITAATDFISTTPAMRRWIESARSGPHWFAKLDQLTEAVHEESGNRFLIAA